MESSPAQGKPWISVNCFSASLNRVARVMCDVGIQGVTRRKWTKTTVRDEDERAAPDLVDRDFTATGPDQLWWLTSRTSRRGRASCIWRW